MQGAGAYDCARMNVDPANLHLRIYPDPVLRQRAKPVLAVDDGIRAIVDRMIEVMDEEDGIGLAAPQVGLAIRLFIADVPPNEDRKRSLQDDPPTATDGPVAYINPVISAPTGGPEPMEEGCLSLPDIRGDVLRPPTVTMTYTNLDGEQVTQTATGLLARCWQHEMDHLDGVLIIDRMTQLFRMKNKAAVRDLERDAEV